MQKAYRDAPWNIKTKSKVRVLQIVFDLQSVHQHAMGKLRIQCASIPRVSLPQVIPARLVRFLACHPAVPEQGKNDTPRAYPGCPDFSRKEVTYEFPDNKKTSPHAGLFSWILFSPFNYSKQPVIFVSGWGYSLGEWRGGTIRESFDDPLSCPWDKEFFRMNP
jgi:hypothetical protein